MVLFQKMGGMLQEALAMPGPVLSQASPTPSQTIMDTTSSTPYSLQGHGAISFSQVGMYYSHILFESCYMQIPKHISIQHFNSHAWGSFFPGQWQQLPDATISGGTNYKAGAAQPVGLQQHVLFPVGEE
jgi:hypothetical protein